VGLRSASERSPDTHEGDERDRNATDRRPRDLAEGDRHAVRQGEGAHPRGDAIAEARWRLPMVEVDPTSAVVGAAAAPAHRHLPGAGRSSLRWGP